MTLTCCQKRQYRTALSSQPPMSSAETSAACRRMAYQETEQRQRMMISWLVESPGHPSYSIYAFLVLTLSACVFVGL